MKWIAPAARLILGGTFLYAGIIKASGSRSFALALAPFMNLPGGWLGPLAITLILAEILSGILILIPRVWPLGAAGILFLTLLYAGVISWGLINGIVIDCACFGRDETPSDGKMELAVVRDLVLAGMALFTLIHWKIKRAGERVSPAQQGASSRH